MAILANPLEGKLVFESLIGINNKDIRKVVKENLKKKRLIKMDKNWVNHISGSLGAYDLAIAF